MYYLERIKDLRQDHNLTQKQIAQKLGIAQNTYSQYENGVNGLPVEILIALCKLYNVSADYILGLSNNKKIK
ncbi:MAG TPA: helix-turn-helix transcriptional regulator [Candidatus Pullilachnospira intestinigallinarum]|nr:helix-turn-helix transcriptional regulator [Candidatus Pullilachnospira intestinigallinarum]